MPPTKFFTLHMVLDWWRADLVSTRSRCSFSHIHHEHLQCVSRLNFKLLQPGELICFYTALKRTPCNICDIHKTLGWNLHNNWCISAIGRYNSPTTVKWSQLFFKIFPLNHGLFWKCFNRTLDAGSNLPKKRRAAWTHASKPATDGIKIT